MTIPTFTIPPGASRVEAEFVARKVTGSACVFFLWDRGRDSIVETRESDLTHDRFSFTVEAAALRGHTVEWDFVMWSFSEQTDHSYELTVNFYADGTQFGSFFKEGQFSEMITFRASAELT